MGVRRDAGARGARVLQLDHRPAGAVDGEVQLAPGEDGGQNFDGRAVGGHTEGLQGQHGAPPHRVLGEEQASTGRAVPAEPLRRPPRPASSQAQGWTYRSLLNPDLQGRQAVHDPHRLHADRDDVGEEVEDVPRVAGLA
jgi:hypothetical protein